jgi:hypothetical protein
MIPYQGNTYDIGVAVASDSLPDIGAWVGVACEIPVGALKSTILPYPQLPIESYVEII